MNLIFIEPAFPDEQRQFVRALAAVGARVIGIGERPLAMLGDELRGQLFHYEQIGSVVDEGALLACVRRIQSKLWIDRLEATVEAHILPAARVREACGIPGISERTAWLCRDKPSMKAALRAAGVPCAQSDAAGSADEIRAFAAKVRFPIIIKPRAGAGAAGTVRVDGWPALEATLRTLGPGSVAVEEFIQGHEGFLDTISIGGDVAHEFISHYYPNVLEAMRERWISPQIVATNRVDAPGYDELKQMARRVIKALGIGTAATHMEWFYGPKGLKFSEIGCRPPGVGQWHNYAAANELDIYREWAMTIVHRRIDQRPSRRFAAGIVALRPDRDGRIVGYEGAERVWQQWGEHIFASHLPAPGTATQPVEAGYLANAWLRARHSDYDELRRILDGIGQTLKVRAG